jgi:hypothetical protein
MINCITEIINNNVKKQGPNTDPQGTPDYTTKVTKVHQKSYTRLSVG